MKTKDAGGRRGRAGSRDPLTRCDNLASLHSYRTFVAGLQPGPKRPGGAQLSVVLSDGAWMEIVRRLADLSVVDFEAVVQAARVYRRLEAPLPATR